MRPKGNDVIDGLAGPDLEGDHMLHGSDFGDIIANSHGSRFPLKS